MRVPTRSARHQVRGELDATKRAADHLGQGFDRGRLGQTGYTLEQHVAARQQRHQQAFEQAVLANDQPTQLEEHLFQLTSGRRWRRGISVAGGEGGSGRSV